MCKPAWSVSCIQLGLFCCLVLMLPAAAADAVIVAANAHVCNSETETQRLADNPQLREMAKALVEFKPTKYCFILPAAARVTLLERHKSYIKFDYKSQVLFTFGQYVTADALAQQR
uniref:Uncharacterized protein n=1 Tax=Rheinheimera sp. BAL341 TaxID=1708203 RepID=A0A486XRC2_9GAMM